MSLLTTLAGWFRFGGFALADRKGTQVAAPTAALVGGTRVISPDSALQISTVWGCVNILVGVLASLPLFVYADMGQGRRVLARDTGLWALLHDSPNWRMTPAEFWGAMLLNLLLRGNAYARIERGANGEAFALWPMSADQVEIRILDDGAVVYLYRLDSDLAVLAAENVLHLKGLGNGTVGLSRLDYMRATVDEAANAQTAANRLFANGGKPTGVLMIDQVFNKAERDRVKANFEEMATGSASRLFVLEANMKYQQINLSPADMELLTTRQFSVEEVCRWFGVPPVMVGHANVTTWGSGVEQILEGFYKVTVAPAVVSIQQAIAKRVLTAGQRARYTVEFSIDALLRANLKDRAAIYATQVQNGLKTRNEVRQLENDPPITGGDELTVQVNLVPIDKLGQQAMVDRREPPPKSLSAELEHKAALEAADRRHAEVMTEMRVLSASRPGITVAPVIQTPDVKIDNHVATPAVTVTTPDVKIDNHVALPAVTVHGAPLTVQNQVEPTPITLEAKIDNVMPEEMRVRIDAMPARATTTSVKRDRDGNIIQSTQTETDL